MSRRKFRKLEFLRNLKGFLGAFLMRVWLISVFKLVSSKIPTKPTFHEKNDS